MSGYPGGSGEGNGLDSLFAQLRQQQNKPINLEPSYGYYNNGYYGQPSQSQQFPGYQQPSVSSAIPTPPTQGLQPHHSSATMSPVETSQPRIPAANGGASNADRTSSLLNLLKFSQPSAGSPKQPAPIGTPLPLSRESSSSFPNSDTIIQAGIGHRHGDSDLLATLMGSIQPKPVQRPSPNFAAAPQSASFSSSSAETAPSADSQTYLLQLLNQSKPAQSDATPQLKESRTLTPPSKASSRDDVGDLTQTLEDTSLDIKLMGSVSTEGRLEGPLLKDGARQATPKNTQGLFTYVNPFEQLAASSPLARTPKNSTPGPSASATPAIQILKRQGDSSDNKRKMDERSTISSPAHSKRKLETPSESSSRTPTPLPDGRTQLEALIGIGASGAKKVEVADPIDKQAQESTARDDQDDSQAAIEKDLQDMLAAKTEKEFEHTAQVAAIAIKKQLEKKTNSGALDSLPSPVADAVLDIIDDVAHGHIADSWESADADDSGAKEEVECVVKVYNFPMKPFISITINESEERRPTFRDEIVMDIARLKKEFDQIDRTLVTASNNFIVYGMSKNGGIRIIRQDDGKDARLFTETHDRIFSVVTSVSAADLKETLIGTGISGTVYWALVKDGQGDHIEDSHPETYGFALPPIQSQENESPGGVLKTRARKSSAHPDFFAVGRGKFIHIIWPSIIMKSYLKHGKERIVDTDKYLARHSLKINTGKAGKDFTFSEDDTIIVSLDKAGRVKFWDVRTLTKTDVLGKPLADTQPIEIKEPLITFTTTPPSEKSWPTSVLFVDKLRPYQRGGALRYLIVGMKQNHTLQLWDLALGKPVQEIHLPHSKESDAVCSVMYHAATGMVVVGHPTRNSIYFLHLSAPKYTLPKSVTQAEYMQKLVAKDSSILHPDSTAVISGMREYSFDNKGLLRSLDILQTPASSAVDGEPTTLFELYAMHSKGVTCLAIKQADLGWTLDNKVIQEIVADVSGVISIEKLEEIPVALIPEVSESTPHPSIPTRIVPRPTPKETVPKETPKKAGNTDASATAASSSKVEDKAEKKEPNHNGGFGSASGAEKLEKAEKKKRRKPTASSETTASGSTNTPQIVQASKTIVLDPSSNSRNGSTPKTNINPIPEDSVAALQDSNAESRVAEEVKKLFGESLDSLYQNIKDDRRTQAAVADAKQDAMLRLVSSTLSDNIEATLARIVGTSIQQSVLPAVSDVSLKAVNEQLGSKLNSHLSNNLPKELQKGLPDAIGKALQQPQLLKLMSDSLAKSVAFRVEDQFAVILQKVVTPAFTQLAVQTSQRVAADVQRQAEEQIGTIERQRHADSIKIEQLMQLVTGLSETVSTMAQAQAEFQGQFLRMQQQLSAEKREAARHSQSGGGTSTSLAAPVEKTPQQLEYEGLVDAINSDMNDGDYPNAILRWLRSGLHQEIFEGLFWKYNPNFIRDFNPIYLIALGSVVTERLEGDLMLQRLAWLDAILSGLLARVTAGDVDEEEIRGQLTKIVATYIQRLEHLFMVVTNARPGDALLKRISLMSTAASHIIQAAREPSSSPQSLYTGSVIGNTGRRL